MTKWLLFGFLLVVLTLAGLQRVNKGLEVLEVPEGWAFAECIENGAHIAWELGQQ